MFADTSRYAFSLCEGGRKSYDYETYLSEKKVISMGLIYERTTVTEDKYHDIGSI